LGLCAAIVAHQGLGFRGVTVAVSPPLYAGHLTVLAYLCPKRAAVVRVGQTHVAERLEDVQAVPMFLNRTLV